MKKLILWSKANYHYLPWRADRSLYRTLVSEIMLQQTTVTTVMNRFENFMQKFPHIKSLAKASEAEVLKAWEGLGYYRRARNLHAAAKMIEAKWSGEFSEDFEELKSIKGIGDYTANAILAMGMNKKALAIDANIERVLSRYFAFSEEKGPKLMKKISQEFKDGTILNAKVSFRELNEALMDVGRVHCKAKTASCELCPLNTNCQAFSQGKALSFPQNSLKKVSAMEELELLRFIIKKGDKIFVYQKKADEWLAGQWEFPSFVVKSTDQKLKQYPKLQSSLKPYLSYEKLQVKTGITKYKIMNFAVELKTLPPALKSLGEFKALKEIQLSSACQKLLTI